MARFIYQGTFKDQSGKIVPSGTISVYESGGTTAANVYTASSGGSAVNSVTSDSTDGSFSFYVDTDDYSRDQKFRITLSKSNYKSKTYDEIVIPGFYAETAASAYYYLTDFDDIADAATTLNALGTDCTIILDNDQTMDENVSFDTEVMVQPVPGKVATLGAYNLTVKNLAPTGLFQWVSKNSTGNLVFGEAATDVVRPEWWGIDGTDDHTEINAAIVAANGADCEVKLLGKEYAVDSEIQVYPATRLVGIPRETVLTWQTATANDDFVIRTVDSSGNSPPTSGVRTDDYTGPQIFGVIVDCDEKADVGIMVEGSYDTIIDRCVIRNVDDGTFTYDDGNGDQTYKRCGIALKGIYGSPGIGCHQNKVRDTKIYGTSGTDGNVGIWVGTTTGQTTYKSNSNTIEGCFIWYCEIGLSIEQGSDNIAINNDFTDCVTGIQCGASANGNSLRNHFIKPYLECDTNGIVFEAGSQYNIVENVGSWGSVAADNKVVDTGGFGNHVDTSGYLSETSVTSLTNNRLYVTEGNMFQFTLGSSGTLRYLSKAPFGKIITIRSTNVNLTIAHDYGSTPTNYADIILKEKKDLPFYGVDDFSMITLQYGGTSGSEAWYEIGRTRHTEGEVVKSGTGLYDQSVDGNITAGSTEFLGYLPDNARIIRAWYEVLTTMSSNSGGDLATIGIGIQTDDVGGIVAPIAINDGTNPWDKVGAGGTPIQCIQDGAIGNISEKTTGAAREIRLEVAVEDVDAGKIRVWWEYIVSE